MRTGMDLHMSMGMDLHMGMGMRMHKDMHAAESVITLEQHMVTDITAMDLVMQRMAGSILQHQPSMVRLKTRHRRSEGVTARTPKKRKLVVCLQEAMTAKAARAVR